MNLSPKSVGTCFECSSSLHPSLPHHPHQSNKRHTWGLHLPTLCSTSLEGIRQARGCCGGKRAGNDGAGRIPWSETTSSAGCLEPARRRRRRRRRRETGKRKKRREGERERERCMEVSIPKGYMWAFLHFCSFSLPLYVFPRPFLPT